MVESHADLSVSMQHTLCLLKIVLLVFIRGKTLIFLHYICLHCIWEFFVCCVFGYQLDFMVGSLHQSGSDYSYYFNYWMHSHKGLWSPLDEAVWFWWSVTFPLGPIWGLHFKWNISTTSLVRLSWSPGDNFALVVPSFLFCHKVVRCGADGHRLCELCWSPDFPSSTIIRSMFRLLWTSSAAANS